MQNTRLPVPLGPQNSRTMPLPYERMSSRPASRLYFLYLSNELMVLMMLSLISFGSTTLDIETVGVYRCDASISSLISVSNPTILSRMRRSMST